MRWRRRPCDFFQAAGLGAVLSAARASYLSSRGERWGRRRVARLEKRKAMKLGLNTARTRARTIGARWNAAAAPIMSARMTFCIFIRVVC